ncbi:hypothetical protein [Aquabacterium sp.]|uniref:hypothetical protein n=1 Tax=Aquabacterium sp. TaxID=1872578 RepID=UPI0019CEBC34|nr:hypothetical protein [Aquabacterium sp.]MBC7699357.1 hypothetical protein [Aquabacterium sp.]
MKSSHDPAEHLALGRALAPSAKRHGQLKPSRTVQSIAGLGFGIGRADGAPA